MIDGADMPDSASVGVSGGRGDRVAVLGFATLNPTFYEELFAKPLILINQVIYL